MASALLASRNEPCWGDRAVYMRKNPNPNPKLCPNPNPNFNSNTNGHGSDNQNPFQPMESDEPAAPNVAGAAVSDDSSCFNRRPADLVHRRDERGHVTFSISAYSKQELRELKRRLISELEQIRTVASRIKSREVQSSFRSAACSASSAQGGGREASAAALPVMARSDTVARRSVPDSNQPFHPADIKKRPGTDARAAAPELKKLHTAMMKKCSQMLTKLMKHKGGVWFNTPVDIVRLGIHDYHQIIKNPMDLGTVKSKLANGVYTAPLDFASDVRLTFSNALAYTVSKPNSSPKFSSSMSKTNAAKPPANNRNNKKQKLGLEPKKFPLQSQQKQENPIKSNPKTNNHNSIHDEDPILFGYSAGADESESESESEPEPEPEPESEYESESGSDIPSESSSPTRIQSTLATYTKPQLVEFILEAALSDPELRSRIRSQLYADSSHRKIYVVGFGGDGTKENLIEVFSPFGPIENCHAPVDKADGRSKGYGFVLFKARSGAVKALKEPQKWIGSRQTICRMAAGGQDKPNNIDRKIYVFNVPPDAQQERLREFFAKFGEIESAVMSIDGNSRGYATIVYKTREEAEKVLEEPHKKFDERQLYCKMAVPGVGEVQKVAAPVSHVHRVAPAATGAVAAQAVVPQQSVHAAVAAAQNITLSGQNPTYAALMVQKPPLTAATLNPSLVTAPALRGAAGVPYGGGTQPMHVAYNTFNPSFVNAPALRGAVGVPYGGGTHPMHGGYSTLNASLVNVHALGGAVGVPYGGGTQPRYGAYSTGQVSGVIGLQGLQGYQAGSYSDGGQSSGRAGADFREYKASYL